MPLNISASALKLLVTLAVGALASANPAGAQTKAPQPILREEFVEAVSISGEALRGVQLLAAPGALQLDAITVYSVKPSDRHLCVSILSRDGRYRAELETEVRVATPGAVVVPFRSRYARFLSQLSGNDVALLARVSDRRTGASCEGEVAPAAFGPSDPQAPLAFFVNSTISQVRARLELDGSASSVPAECNRLDGVTIAFDTLCVLPPELGCGDGVAVVLRRRGANRFPPVQQRMRAVCKGD